jgi:hypothetical protein
LCMDGHCVCMSGATGADCSAINCPEGTNGPTCQYRSCLRDCSGYGICFNGECTCDNDHMGPDCSIPKKCYDACYTVCSVDLVSPKCEFCKGQCLTLAMNPVVGNHNPMLARLYSFSQFSAHPTSTSAVSSQRRKPASKMPMLKMGRHLQRRHHTEVSVVQISRGATKKRHHPQVSSVKVGDYNPYRV